jgi:FkbM family methyltransferase
MTCGILIDRQGPRYLQFVAGSGDGTQLDTSGMAACIAKMMPKSLTQILPNTPPIHVVHVGASIVPEQVEAYETLVDLGYATVTGFEPNPAELAKLNATQRKGRRYLPYMVGEGGPGLFYETSNPWMGSLLEPDHAVMDRFHYLGSLAKVIATHNVMTHRLDDIAELQQIDFLKIDIQGAELSAMRGAERLLASCLAIQTEVEFLPLYKSQPLYGDVDRYLTGRGFLFHTFRDIAGRCFEPLMVQNEPRATLNQFLWADAIFVRDFRTITALSTDQLMKFAVLLHDIYGSSDLCLLALIELDRRAGHGPEYEGAYLEMMPVDAG